jgi:broad specificity phosphatase PhoE
MRSLTILIIRHAEKPDEDWPGPGLTDKGQEDTESLVIRGWQRAGAWTALFGAGLDGDNYPTPQAVYAATPGAHDKLNQGPSRRPYETVLPLAQRLKLPEPNTSFATGQEGELVEELLALSDVALVAWEHKAIISDILPRLPVRNKSDLPTHWPDHRFDVVLRFDRAAGETDFVFSERCPRLMWRDSNQPLTSDPEND